MLHSLAPTRHEARCDRCLKPSPLLAHDDPAVARIVAVEHLLGLGWRNTPPADRSATTPVGAGLWFCVDCPTEVVVGPVRRGRSGRR